jgi:hypothetical protein
MVARIWLFDCTFAGALRRGWRGDTARNRSLGVVDRTMAVKVMTLMQQIG